MQRKQKKQQHIRYMNIEGDPSTEILSEIFSENALLTEMFTGQ